MTPHGSVADLYGEGGPAASFQRSAPPEPHGKPRSFLFLQGPISGFFDRLGRALIARGHRVHRVNLHLGDRLYWRLPASDFRGRFDEWRGFVAGLMEAHRVTDLIVHGDRRPYHLVAAEEARARGIAVISTDLGYLRPDWLTFEYDGMSSYSRFPRDPVEIRKLAAEFPPVDLAPRFQTRFALIATLDVAHNFAEVLGRPLYPYYRRYGINHPFVEYAGWLGALVRRRWRRPAMNAAKARLEREAGSYFLFPLQLASDYQIRAHSPFADAREAVCRVVDSFAASGSRRRLVAVVHPLDNGLIDWRRVIAAQARKRGVHGRVEVLDGGTPVPVMAGAAGIVTINSTVGLAGLRLGVAVKVLGNAVFDVPGLTDQKPLESFWHAPSPPDPELLDAFIRALAGATQVKGGYYERGSQEHAVAGAVARLEAGLHPLPPLSPEALAARVPRRGGANIVVTGASRPLGLAVARAVAEPGISLYLIGAAAPDLDRLAQDCRLRGARVETARIGGKDREALAARLEAIDRRAPADILLACPEPAPFAAAGHVRDPGPRHLPIGPIDRSVVTILAERMRRRGHGRIVMIDPSGGFSGFGSAGPVERGRDTASRAALVAWARSLRRELRRDNVGVSLVGPGAIALRRWGRRQGQAPVAPNPDRIAALARRPVAAGGGRVRDAARWRLAGQAWRGLRAALGGWGGGTLLAEPVARSDDPSVLFREPSGD